MSVRLDPERLAAAAMFIDQGLVVVPYRSPWDIHAANPGKSPIPNPANDYHRFECSSMADFEPVLARYPDMNIALLGVVQVDADDASAIAMAAALGVRSKARCWVMRTNRGWKALYRPPEMARGLTNVSYKWCIHCPHSGEHPEPPFQLDLLVNSPAVVPPSIHPKSKQPYRWHGPNTPETIRFHSLDHPPTGIVARWTLLNAGVHSVAPAKSTPVGDDVKSQLRSILAAWGRGGRLPRPTSDGWMTLHCGLPTHQGQDRRPSFRVNLDGAGGWICFVDCGKGSVAELARRLGIELPDPTAPAWEVRS